MSSTPELLTQLADADVSVVSFRVASRARKISPVALSPSPAKRLHISAAALLQVFGFKPLPGRYQLDVAGAQMRYTPN
jgi:hypothetical protein